MITILSPILRHYDAPNIHYANIERQLQRIIIVCISSAGPAIDRFAHNEPALIITFLPTSIQLSGF